MASCYRSNTECCPFLIRNKARLYSLISSVQHFTEDSNSSTSGGNKKIGKEEVNLGKEEVNLTLFTDINKKSKSARTKSEFRKFSM